MKYLKRFNESHASKLDVRRFSFPDRDYIEELYEKGVLDKDVYEESIQKDLPEFKSKKELLDYLYDLGGIDRDDYQSELSDYYEHELP